MKGLIIRQPWIGLILDGKKTWEMRSRPTEVRGTIALIQAKTSLVLGTATLVSCGAPLTHDNYMQFQDHHAIPVAMLDEVVDSGWLFPWLLEDIHRLERPVPARAKPGAVTFVNLEPFVTDAIVAAAQGLRSTTDVGSSPQAPVVPSNRHATPPPAPQLTAPVRPGSDELLFEFRYEGAHACGRPGEGKSFLVLKGSTAVREGSALVKRDIVDRDRLVDQGILVPDANPELYRFTTDWKSSSASKAAGIIKNGNASGPQLWEHKQTGQNLKAYQDHRKAHS